MAYMLPLNIFVKLDLRELLTVYANDAYRVLYIPDTPVSITHKIIRYSQNQRLGGECPQRFELSDISWRFNPVYPLCLLCET